MSQLHVFTFCDLNQSAQLYNAETKVFSIVMIGMQCNYNIGIDIYQNNNGGYVLAWTWNS